MNAQPYPSSDVRAIRREHDQIVATRHQRIERLCAFLAHCTRMARHTGAAGWYGQHAFWAARRLAALDYRFPECDSTPWSRR